jgi:hypothetical protein
VLRFDDEFPGLSVLDVDQRLVAFSVQHADDAAHIGVSLYGADEDAQEAGSAFGSDRLGVQLQAGTRFASGHGLRFHLGLETRNFDDAPGFFGGIDRSDQSWSAAVTGDIRDWPAKGYLLMPRSSRSPRRPAPPRRASSCSSRERSRSNARRRSPCRRGTPSRPATSSSPATSRGRSS